KRDFDGNANPDFCANKILIPLDLGRSASFRSRKRALREITCGVRIMGRWICQRRRMMRGLQCLWPGFFSRRWCFPRSSQLFCCLLNECGCVHSCLLFLARGRL
ncbi:hypothetical protein, conserved, partial [Trypanosoma cruzi]